MSFNPEAAKRFQRIRGAGSGTSDSIPAFLPEGGFVVPADSTERIGAEKLRGMASPDRIPAEVSDGESWLSRDALAEIGAKFLAGELDRTHKPVEEPRGFHAEAAAKFRNGGKVCRKGFADGGLVDDELKNPVDAREPFPGFSQADGGLVDDELKNPADAREPFPGFSQKREAAKAEDARYRESLEKKWASHAPASAPPAPYAHKPFDDRKVSDNQHLLNPTQRAMLAPGNLELANKHRQLNPAAPAVQNPVPAAQNPAPAQHARSVAWDGGVSLDAEADGFGEERRTASPNGAVMLSDAGGNWSQVNGNRLENRINQSSLDQKNGAADQQGMMGQPSTAAPDRAEYRQFREDWLERNKGGVASMDAWSRKNNLRNAEVGAEAAAGRLKLDGRDASNFVLGRQDALQRQYAQEDTLANASERHAAELAATKGAEARKRSFEADKARAQDAISRGQLEQGNSRLAFDAEQARAALALDRQRSAPEIQKQGTLNSLYLALQKEQDADRASAIAAQIRLIQNGGGIYEKMSGGESYDSETGMPFKAPDGMLNTYTGERW